MVRRGLEEWSWNLDTREPFTWSFLRPVPQLPLYPSCTFFILNVTEKKNSRENQWNQNRLTRSTKMTNFSYTDRNKKKIITFPVFQAQGSSCWHWAHVFPGLCPYTHYHDHDCHHHSQSEVPGSTVRLLSGNLTTTRAGRHYFYFPEKLRLREMKSFARGLLTSE